MVGKKRRKYKRRDKDYVLKNYKTPGHPTFMRGNTGLYKYLANGKKNISPNTIDQWLATVDAYTKHREVKKPAVYNPIFVYKRRELLQIDLADVSQLSRSNNGVKYLLTAIDTFSRKAWIETLHNKRADSVLHAFRTIIHQMGEVPSKLLCDQGKEFKNMQFQNYLSEMRIKMIHLYSDQKAAHVERFNRTIKRLIYSYMTLENTNRYVQVLPALLRTYNSRWHRSINTTPKQADLPHNNKKVLDTLNTSYDKVRNLKKHVKLKIGDQVRVHKYKSKFKKGYQRTFRSEIFTIYKVDTVKPIPLYHLEDEEGEKVEGGWYSQELQRVIDN